MKIGPKYKICRRLGSDIFEKCQTQKYTISEAKKTRVTRNKKRPAALTDYGKQMRNKQKVRLSYRVSEKQFANYVKSAMGKKGSNSAELLYQELESRLDNVVYRLGLAATRGLARQMVSHGHIDVNGKRITIPSFKLSIGDKIAVRERSKSKTLFNQLDENKTVSNPPSWLKFDSKTKEAIVANRPIGTESMLDLNSVIEFYSR
jgi:small subunit ribosomal protein S4